MNFANQQHNAKANIIYEVGFKFVFQTIVFQKTFIIGYETKKEDECTETRRDLADIKKDNDLIKIPELMASEGEEEDKV